MTDWVRLWHDMPTDPKWRSIARKAGQPLPCVIALFNLIMVNASGNAEHRGTLRNWDDEDAAAALDMETDAVTAIMQAMQGKVLEGERLTGWEKRQPKREDDGAASRKRAQREREKEQCHTASRNVTQRHAPETETDTDTDIPFSNENGASPEKDFWDRAKPYIGGRNPGAVIGKWCRDHGKAETKRAIGEAQAANAVDPIPYITKLLRRAQAADAVPIC